MNLKCKSITLRIVQRYYVARHICLKLSRQSGEKSEDKS